MWVLQIGSINCSIGSCWSEPCWMPRVHTFLFPWAVFTKLCVSFYGPCTRNAKGIHCTIGSPEPDFPGIAWITYSVHALYVHVCTCYMFSECESVYKSLSHGPMLVLTYCVWNNKWNMRICIRVFCSGDSHSTESHVGLDKNYCRNPDRDKHGPWCYTNPNNRLVWDYCKLKHCEWLNHFVSSNLFLCNNRYCTSVLWLMAWFHWAWLIASTPDSTCGKDINDGYIAKCMIFLADP